MKAKVRWDAFVLAWRGREELYEEEEDKEEERCPKVKSI